jgi:ankyrin repeat protein
VRAAHSLLVRRSSPTLERMNSRRSLSELERTELASAFSDVINYDAEDPLAPIDPLTYRSPDGDSCLHIAAIRGNRGNLRAVQLLVSAGLDVNERGDMGYTPLHYARTPEVVAFLLQNGADPGIKNEFGNSPVGWPDES